MSHTDWSAIPTGPFKQSGIGFKGIADIGIIVESYRLFEGVLAEKSYSFRRISSYHLDYDWLTLEHGGRKFAVAVSQGAPMAVDLAERYLSSGISQVIRIGTAGALHESQQMGDIVLPYAAIRDEGTSGFYLSANVPALADIDLTQTLSASLRRRSICVHNGIIWSTDGRWKETDDSVARQKANGAIATDMETSALFAFGQNRHCRVASVSLLSDEIHRDEGSEQKGLSDKDVWFGHVIPRFVETFGVVLETEV